MPASTSTPPSTPTPSTSSTPPSSSNARFFGCLGFLTLAIMVSAVWVFLTAPKVKEYAPPDRLELTTQEVPVSHQLLVLMENHTGSPYFQPIRQDISSLTAVLSDEEKICLFQVASDQPVMPVEPWCSRQIKSTWWVMPEIKPAPYNSPGEAKAYREAQVKLEADLKDKTDRAQVAWEVERTSRLRQVDNLLWQLPEQPYLSLVDSLSRLLRVRYLTRHIPTDLIIYSGLVDQLFTQPVQQSVDLRGVNVQVKVLTSGGEVEKDRLVALWEPWLKSGEPDTLSFSLMEPAVDESVAQTKRPHPSSPEPMENGGLPPVVNKPIVADRTNVVEGESISGDATNVIREVDGNLP